LWQKKSTKDSDFLEASGNDQKFMNNKFRTIISSVPKNGNKRDQTESGVKDDSKKGDNDNGKKEENTEADKYWIDLDKLSDEKLKGQKTEITPNLNSSDKKPTTQAGKKAKNSVQSRLNSLN
jgi:hypothetical protein